MNIKVLVSGANGQLGLALQSISSFYPNLYIDFIDRNHLDLSQLEPNFIPDILSKSVYDYYVHAAAYTAVDLAEEEIRKCFQINEIAVKQLVTHFSQKKTKFIYISSDYVYHSSQNTPFKETDLPQPKGVYAKSKLAGEEAVKKQTDHFLIFRTSWVYGEHGKNFIRTMDRLGREKEQIQVVFDQIGSPTYVYDLANMLLTIINNGKAKVINGTFNYSNEGITSWYDIAHAIMLERGYSTKIIPVRTNAFPLPAPRPPFSAMDKSLFKENFGIEIPHWQESLQKCLRSLPL
ncbi:MAG: dTDP-4-dehydrorhamnose reductase [Bacteroidetes bacterium]|nr:dTDP-4-dehydrorhamnose reductase [Bacteroidota bacterium]